MKNFNFLLVVLLSILCQNILADYYDYRNGQRYHCTLSRNDEPDDRPQFTCSGCNSPGGSGYYQYKIFQGSKQVDRVTFSCGRLECDNPYNDRNSERARLDCIQSQRMDTRCSRF